MSECQQDLREAGRACPRTCAVCGLGPCQRRPLPTSTAPDDVLVRLKVVISAFEGDAHTRAVIEIDMLRSAAAEIERLRAEIARENSAYVRAFEADQAPKPERWQVRCVPPPSKADWLTEDGEPFAVTNTAPNDGPALVWFRRRVPT